MTAILVPHISTMVHQGDTTCVPRVYRQAQRAEFEVHSTDSQAWWRKARTGLGQPRSCPYLTYALARHTYSSLLPAVVTSLLPHSQSLIVEADLLSRQLAVQVDSAVRWRQSLPAYSACSGKQMLSLNHS